MAARRALIFGAWLLLVILFATQWYAYDASRATAEPFSYYVWWSGYIWALLTPSALWLAWRFPVTASNWRGRLALHVAASIVLTGVELSLESYLGWMRHGPGQPAMSAFRHYFSQHTQVSLLTYWLVVGGVWFYRSREEVRESTLRSSRLATQLTAARLEVLRRQLHPHFLFNTLTAAITLIHDDPDRAEEVLVRLSDLLRISLQESEAAEIPLSRELEILERYIGIQSCRFQDRLHFEMRIDDAARLCLVPSLLLQPLVENAVTYGVGTHKGNDTVTVLATRERNRLRLAISNAISSLGDGAEVARRRGVGLTSTRERLAQLYGTEQSSLRLSNLQPAGVCAEVLIPARTGPANLAPPAETFPCRSAR